MNKEEQAELVQHQRAAGLKHGEAIARIVIAKFPNRFDPPVALSLRKIEDDAITHTVNALAANGVEKRYIKPFKRGFVAGLRNTYFGNDNNG